MSTTRRSFFGRLAAVGAALVFRKPARAATCADAVIEPPYVSVGEVGKCQIRFNTSTIRCLHISSRSEGSQMIVEYESHLPVLEISDPATGEWVNLDSRRGQQLAFVYGRF